MRAREVRNKAEAVRLLGLLHKSRASEVQEWEEVGRCLCMASPDLQQEWVAWTQQYGLKTYPALLHSGDYYLIPYSSSHTLSHTLSHSLFSYSHTLTLSLTLYVQKVVSVNQWMRVWRDGGVYFDPLLNSTVRCCSSSILSTSRHCTREPW